MTSCGDGNLRAFDAKTGTLQRTFIGHTMPVNAFKVILDYNLNLFKFYKLKLFTTSFYHESKIIYIYIY